MRTIHYCLLAMLIMPVMTIASETDMAKIITHTNVQESCIAAVEITRIDGEYRTLPAIGFDLEPGHHTMWGGDVSSSCSIPSKRGHPVDWGRRERKEHQSQPLEFTFEAGKTYYVGSKFDPEQSWTLQVWKVESAEGEVEFDLSKSDQN